MSREDQAALMRSFGKTINVPYQYIVGAIHFNDDEISAEEVVR